MNKAVMSTAFPLSLPGQNAEVSALFTTKTHNVALAVFRCG